MTRRGVPIQGGDTAVPLFDQRGFLSEPHIYGLSWGPVVDSEGGAWVPGHPWGARNYFVTRMAPDGSHRTGGNYILDDGFDLGDFGQ